VIREEDINRLLDCRARDLESIPEWRRRHDVDEAAIRRLATVYGFNRQYAVFAIDASDLCAENLSPRDRKANIECGLLRIVLDQYPVHLSASDLIRRALAVAPRSTEKQAVEQGLGRLGMEGCWRKREGEDG
jgi:hypothetical protein